MSLPLGVYEMIVEYLPSPHAWKWSLNHLKRRAIFSPQITVNDTSLLIDELLSELKILDFPHQKGTLMRIATSPEVGDDNQIQCRYDISSFISLSQIRQSLVNDLHLPETLVESLVRWSDVQNLNFRTTDLDISFKSSLAKRYLVVAITLYRMVRLVHDPAKLFTLPKMMMQPPPCCLMLSKKEQRQDILQINQNLLLSNNSSLPIPPSIHPSTVLLDEMLLHQTTLQQMFTHDGTLQPIHGDTLDDEDSLNEFSCLTNDHDTETELAADGGQFAGSDDEEDDN
jgi:hypothetical protein